MSDIVERWPGYTEQSWSERFAELDKAFKHQQAIIDGLVRQIVTKSAELAEARDKALDEAAEVVEQYATKPLTKAKAWTDDQSDWWESGQVDCALAAAQAIRALKSPKPQSALSDLIASTADEYDLPPFL